MSEQNPTKSTTPTIIDYMPRRKINATPLADLLGKIITIVYARIDKIMNNDYAIITTEEYGDVYTFSRVVVDQVKDMIPQFSMGVKIRACITKKRRYFTLERPNVCLEVKR